jgi:hypothetical protein
MALAYIKELSEISAEEHEALKVLKAEYKPAKNGGFFLELEPVQGWNNEHLAPLKNALERQKGENLELKSKYKDIPEDFDLETIEKLRAKYEAAGEFDREAEMKALKIEVSENVGNEFKSLLQGKDDIINDFKEGMRSTARDQLYSQLISEGWKKEPLQGIVEKMTKVEMLDNKAVVTFVDENGQPRHHVEGNGDQRLFNTADLIKQLKNDETYGRMLETDNRSGGGGETRYQGGGGKGIIYVSEAEKGLHMDGIAAGTHEVR